MANSGTPPCCKSLIRFFGAGGRTWTPNLLITSQLLYQLSYTSISLINHNTFETNLLYKFNWRPGSGSNRRPPAWQAGILTNWTTRPNFGGHNRARTYDPLLVRQMLSQLSYASILVTLPGIEPGIPPWKGGVLTAWPQGLIWSVYKSQTVILKMVAAKRFELLTLRVWTVCSSQLSYPHKFGSGRRIWTSDLRVMSPTSYHAAPSRVIFTRLLFLFGAENRNRTDTVFNHRRILSPVRLPVPPPRLIFFNGSQGGTRTHSLPVNSRLLHHWAT